jgi:hypothetical protein
MFRNKRAGGARKIERRQKSMQKICAPAAKARKIESTTSLLLTNEDATSENAGSAKAEMEGETRNNETKKICGEHCEVTL